VAVSLPGGRHATRLAPPVPRDLAGPDGASYLAHLRSSRPGVSSSRSNDSSSSSSSSSSIVPVPRDLPSPDGASHFAHIRSSRPGSIELS